MKWVTGVDYYNDPVAVNLDRVSHIDIGSDYVRFHAERQTDVKKTPELLTQLSTVIPGLVGSTIVVQPVVPAEPTTDEPFRITGVGLYETRAGEEVRICDRDAQDPDLPWVTKDYRWYSASGEWCGKRSEYDIVKLIKLDEVQP